MTGAPTTADLAELEDTVRQALAARDLGALTVLGFGEISMALGWPATEPRFACKRSPPFTRPQFEHYRQLVTRYLGELATRDVPVADTTIVPVDCGDRLVAYLVQPLAPIDAIGHSVLRRADPDPDHPMLRAVAERLSVASPRISIDAQITNWAWDGRIATLLDVGTPFLWDAAGRSEFDMTPFLAMLPWVARPLVRREMTALMGRWQTPRGVAVDAVANLYREGLADWVEPAAEAFGRIVGGEPITAVEAHEIYVEDVETWPRLKRLQQLQRAWQTGIRRRPYPFFIQSTFTGEAS